MKIGKIRNKVVYSNKLGILLLLVLAACQSKSALNETVVTQDTLIISGTTASPTATDEILAAAPTATYIPLMETPLPTPISTMSLREKETVASELYQTNAGCELPCWWGIVPGETEWQTAKLFLSTIATTITTGTQSESDSVFVAEVDIPVPESLSEISNLRHTFIVRDGIVVAIELERPRGNRKILTISDILNNYGPPTEVWLDTLGENYGDNYFPFRVALFYPLQGFLIRYFDEAELTDGYVTGCPQEISGKLSLWSPKRELTFTETLSRQEGVQYYKRLEDATEIDVETFYQLYLDPDTETCIETPAELWMDR